MDIVIAGGHGKIAMLLHPILVERGHSVRGLIRSPDQQQDLRDAGAGPVLFDLEGDDDVTEVIEGADAIVFAAGAGPKSGKERKWTVDRDGAIKLMTGAKRAGIDRYIMLSAMGVDGEVDTDNEVFAAYMEAKSQADEVLKKIGLAYTIVRPGTLTDDEGTGLISLDVELDSGEIPRADVAATIAYALDHPETAGLQVEITSGNTTIDDAFNGVLRQRPSAPRLQ